MAGSKNEELADRVRAGDLAALARVLTVVENEPDCDLARRLRPSMRSAHVVGITGAPGTGKSTLVSALAAEMRRRGRTVAVLAVDPSSPVTGGAVLGDRVRMSELVGDPGVFIRSMAHRGAAGGLAVATSAAVDVLDAAGFDVVLIETLGVGQAEVEIARQAMTTVVVLVPGMGDGVQAMKAGILEIADVYVVNKADLPGAESVVAQLLALAAAPDGATPGRDLVSDRRDQGDGEEDMWSPPVVPTVARTSKGVPELADALEAHATLLRRSSPGEGRLGVDSRLPRAESVSEESEQLASSSDGPEARGLGRDPEHRSVAPSPVGRSTLYDGGLYGRLILASGTANVELAEEIAAHFGLDLLPRDILQFANGNTFVRLRQSVRGADVFWIQPTSPPTNDNLMELLIAIDTLRRDSAARITAVVPYYGYGRTDKKDQPRVPITARLVADMITVAGADRVLTMDLHAGQIQGFFHIPVDDITARHLLAEYAGDRVGDQAVVVAPDLGRAKDARNLAQEMDLPLAIVEKRRSQDGRDTEVLNLIGDVEGCDVLIYDDEIDTASTMAKAAHFLRRSGARNIIALATHPILSPPATERLAASPINEIVITNTIRIPEDRKLPNVTVKSVGPMLGEVIRRIHMGQSVGEMFNE